MDAPLMDFPAALTCLFARARMTIGFLPKSLFIEMQEVDENSMNTEPYFKLVEVNDGGFITSCEPWEPGRRSVFSKEWHVSPFDGKVLTKAPKPEAVAEVAAA